MKHLKKVFSSVWILSLIPVIAVILIIPIKLSRYALEVESSGLLSDKAKIWYNDLDGNGSSETLLATDQNNSTGLSIYNESRMFDQWNFRGTFNFSSKKCLFITGDRDANGIKEVYVFTLSTDTILLHCISNLNDPSLSISNRVIAVAGKGIKSPDPFIIPAEMEDLDGDGTKELIFGIGSGFSEYPRNVFAYYISKDSLVSSPKSSYFIQTILQSDINGDGIREIMPYGNSAANVSKEEAEYHDYSSFLFVLDKNLQFLFHPVEFRGKFSGLTPAEWKTKGENSIICLYNPPLPNQTSCFYIVNSIGRITDSIPLKYHALKCINIKKDENKRNELLVILENGTGIINSDFVLTKSEKSGNYSTFLYDDFDLDGKKEILVTDQTHGKVIVYRDGLRHPVTAEVPLSVDSENNISLKISKENDPLISIQSGQNHVLLKYRVNPAYPFYYALYLVLYGGILSFALVIRQIQQSQLKRKYENEKKISELQLALIRNQLDPHFIFNVINSVMYSIENSEKELAGEQLRQFANLYRNQLLSAGETRRSIDDELNFCNDYLSLEKMRFSEKFDFRISVSEDINRELLIPKLLIQIHAENAVKHGFSVLESGGKLDIDLKMDGNELKIEITDNGIGRAMSGSQVNTSTGKGLKIMEELYSIYSKYYNEKVTSQIIDLYSYNREPAGTKVCISVYLQQSKINT
jgi:hypothetical protein